MSVKIVTPNTSEPQELHQLIKQGMSDEDIRFLLTENYKDDFLVTNLMAEVKKLRNSQKTASGLTLVLLGAFVMLLGFVLAFMGATSGTLLYIFLYGFTGVGLIIVFAGLVKVFQ